jgi:hypothetical protein
MSDRETPQTAAYVRSLGKVALKPAPGMRRTAQRITVAKAAARAATSIHGEGGVAGPDLSVIGESRSAAYLRESIVNPGVAVPGSYLLVTVVPNSGQPVTGARVNEDSFAIQIRDSAGRSYSF